MDSRVTLTTLGEITGIDRRTCKKRLNNLNPAEKKGKITYYWIAEALELVYQVKEDTGKLDYNTENTKLIRAKRIKADLEVEKEKGNLIPYERVVLEFTRFTMATRNKLLSLPTKLAPELSSLDSPAEVQAVLKRNVYEILEELSSDKFSEAIDLEVDAIMRSIEALQTSP